VRVFFLTGPEGSGTTVLARALGNHPEAARGDAARFGHGGFFAEAGAQVIDCRQMSVARPGRVRLPEVEAARAELGQNAARLTAAQPGASALFLKYSTPAFRPRRWPVFEPFCRDADFKVLVAWRRPLDTVYSAYRRFFRRGPGDLRGFAAAAASYLAAVTHIRRQLRRLRHDQYLELSYEEFVRSPDRTLAPVWAFCGLPPCGIDRLLPAERVSDENGKWKRALLGRGPRLLPAAWRTA
jgi:hypothetical protein